MNGGHSEARLLADAMKGRTMISDDPTGIAYSGHASLSRRRQEHFVEGTAPQDRAEGIDLCGKTKPVLNAFLQSLDYNNNPWLCTPEEMLAKGFKGTPYEV